MGAKIFKQLKCCRSILAPGFLFLFYILGPDRGQRSAVPITESVQMAETVKKNGTNVWFPEAKDEGHGFRKKNNIDFQFYATILFVKNYVVND
jgi:hypothetical protein